MNKRPAAMRALLFWGLLRPAAACADERTAQGVILAEQPGTQAAVCAGLEGAPGLGTGWLRCAGRRGFRPRDSSGHRALSSTAVSIPVLVASSGLRRISCPGIPASAPDRRQPRHGPHSHASAQASLGVCITNKLAWPSIRRTCSIFAPRSLLRQCCSGQGRPRSRAGQLRGNNERRSNSRRP